MTNRGQNDSDTIERRKAQLVAQGVDYRSGIKAAEHSIAADLSPGKLAKGVLAHIGSAAVAAFKMRSQAGGVKLQTLLPLVVSTVSALSKRSLLKPVLRVAIPLAAVAYVWAARKRKENARSNATVGRRSSSSRSPG
jgi:hypothetical protein